MKDTQIEGLEEIAEAYERRIFIDAEHFIKTLLADPAILAHIPAYAALREENVRLTDALTPKPPREGIYPWAGPLEKTKQHADYWLQGGAQKCDNHDAIVCMTQASYSWMNCAYHYAEKAYNLEAQLSAIQGGGESIGEMKVYALDEMNRDFTVNMNHRLFDLPLGMHKLYTHAQPATAAKAPPGYALVPIEPTPLMMNAFWTGTGSDRPDNREMELSVVLGAWRCMLAAAPSAPIAEGEE